MARGADWNGRSSRAGACIEVGNAVIMAVKSYVKRLLGLPALPAMRVDLAVLERDWVFQPSRANPLALTRRFRATSRCGEAPDSRILKPLYPRSRWIAYFIYLPTGGLTAAHRYTLERLRGARDAGLLVVCATAASIPPPAELHGIADALYWKDLGGFDFSAYALAIAETARLSPGADLLVQNDSVFGPFCPVDDLWPRMKWDLTGFTASGAVENHIQSYAFCLKSVDASKVEALRAIFPPGRAYQDYEAVLLRQETRMASVAALSMSVGALWYAPPDDCADASLFAALPLVDAGFPFLKRGLLTKHAGIYPRDAVIEVLRKLGHPTP